MSSELERLKAEYDALEKAYRQNRKSLEDHVRTISDFLSDMYAVMTDPMEEVNIVIQEATKDLRERATFQRQHIQDLREALLALKKRDCWCSSAISHTDACAKAIMALGSRFITQKEIDESMARVNLDEVMERATCSRCNGRLGPDDMQVCPHCSALFH